MARKWGKQFVKYDLIDFLFYGDEKKNYFIWKKIENRFPREKANLGYSDNSMLEAVEPHP